MNRRILAAVDDMIFASKIRGTAQQLGVTVGFAKSEDEAFDSAKADVPALVILDLNSSRCRPLSLAARLKADEQLRDVPLLGFLSHVQTELMEEARRAGVDHVMPRSAFVNRLPDVLRGQLSV